MTTPRKNQPLFLAVTSSLFAAASTLAPAGLPEDPEYGDGVVGFGDLLWLLSTWGDCPEPPAECPVDLDGNGSVDFADLLTVLSFWTG